jgi:3-phosphoshikimate 1-carboxyvinyltransferase
MDDPRVTLRVPGDKSLTHRALIFAALADGDSRLSGLLPAEDPHATARVLRALGAPVPELPRAGEEVVVAGRGVRGLAPCAALLDCANSGTTARLMLGVLSGYPFDSTLTGDDSLRSRPMRRVTEPLGRMGARFEELEAPDRLPIRVSGGRLRPLTHRSPKASAQVKSALLLAGVTGGAEVEVREPVLSRDHTERLLRAMGARVTVDRVDDGFAIRLEPGASLRPLDFHVPGDFSSAAFFLALGALLPGGALRVEGVGMNPGRTGLLPVLERMGVEVVQEHRTERSGEPVAELVAGASRLRATTVGGEEVPGMVDEVPILAVLAARAEGETRITGAGELRVKESDRLAALASNLRTVGVRVEELPDGLVVEGTDAPLAGRVTTYGDHRIAMAFGVLGALPGNRIEVDDPACVAVSFPTFWEELRRVAEALRA